MNKPLEMHALVRDSNGVHEWHLVFDPVFPTSEYSRSELIEALESMIESIRSEPPVQER
jgi:hypothetical protein